MVRQVACTNIDGRMINIAMDGRGYGDNLKMNISKLFLDKELTINLGDSLLSYRMSKLSETE